MVELSKKKAKKLKIQNVKKKANRKSNKLYSKISLISYFLFHNLHSYEYEANCSSVWVAEGHSLT